MPRIEEQMSRHVVTVSDDQTLEQAAQMMIERSVGSALITRDGTLEGIITERDILRSVAGGLVPWTTKVSQCMTPNPRTLGPSDSIEEAVRVMSGGGFRHLPIVEDEALVGIITLRDLLRESGTQVKSG
jgi:CBS domain-containing protein